MGALSSPCGFEAHVELAGLETAQLGPTLAALRIQNGPYSTDLSCCTLGAHLGPARLCLPVLPPTLCLSHPTLQDCTAPCPPPPLACPVILPAPAPALCPASALPPPFTSFVKITSVMSWRERRGRRQPRGQGAWHTTGFCLGPAVRRGWLPQGRAGCLSPGCSGRPCGLQGLGRPGLAVAAPW